MDWDMPFSESTSPHTTCGLVVYHNLLVGRLQKPTLVQIMHVYAEDFNELVQASRQLGAEPGQEIKFASEALKRLIP
jgi:plasmid maintenance system antidote protein VapI